MALTRFLFLILLAGVAIVGSSFQKLDQTNRCVPFKGKFKTDFSKGTVGIGQGTHIGKFTLVAEVDDKNFPDITITSTTITAANGDQIYSIGTGFFNVDTGEFDSDNTIIGGTGRFAGATGSYHVHDIVNESAGMGNATFGGTICY